MFTSKLNNKRANVSGIIHIEVLSLYDDKFSNYVNLRNRIMYK